MRIGQRAGRHRAPVVGTALALGILLAACTPSVAPESSASPAARVAHVVRTSADQSVRFDASQTIELEAGGGASGEVVDVDAAAQRISGFGAALTHSAAQLLKESDASARRDLLVELFDPDGDVRLNVVRLAIGGSDFSPRGPFTYADVDEGDDVELESFDIEPDRAAVLPVLEEILEISPDVTVIASPWSAPAWMKDGRDLTGGALRDDDAVYRAYADYLVRFVEAYRDEGVDIDYLTIQNEPQLSRGDGYAAMYVPVWQAAEVIDRLGPALEAGGFATRLLGYDHNWETSAADAEAAAAAGLAVDPDYPVDLLESEAVPWLAGIAYHCYHGGASAQDRVRDVAPDAQIWVTECSGSHAPEDWPEKIFADTLAWQSMNVLIPSLRHGATGVLLWNLALDEDGGPHVGGCETCTGVVTIRSDGTIERNAEFYVLAHAAAFLPVGSVVLRAFDDEDHVVVARTPDGGFVLLGWNPDSEPRTLRLATGDDRLAVQLEPWTLTTVTW